jgi:hypothetical protein
VKSKDPESFYYLIFTRKKETMKRRKERYKE